jgi:hypothetical protein
LLRQKIEYANQVVYAKGGYRSLSEIKISYHDSEIKRLKKLEKLAVEEMDD